MSIGMGLILQHIEKGGKVMALQMGEDLSDLREQKKLLQQTISWRKQHWSKRKFRRRRHEIYRLLAEINRRIQREETNSTFRSYHCSNSYFNPSFKVSFLV